MTKTIQLSLMFFLAMSLACSLTSKPLETNATYALQPVQNLLKQETATAFQPTPFSTPTPPVCIVTAQALHLRTCAGLECTVKDWLREGMQLTIRTSNNGWYEVTTPAGARGWIKSKYCGGKQ